MYGLGAHSGLFLTFGSFVSKGAHGLSLGTKKPRPDLILTLGNSPSLVCCPLASPFPCLTPPDTHGTAFPVVFEHFRGGCACFLRSGCHPQMRLRPGA